MKKLRHCQLFVSTEAIKKILRVMKLTLFLVILCTAGLFAKNSYSQESIVDLRMKNVSVNQVLLEIEKQSDFRFFYNKSQINTDRKVNISASRVKISELLNNLFEGSDVAYTVIEKHIVLVSKSLVVGKGNEAQQIVVSGTVKDQKSGSAIPGVNIKISGSKEGTITDLDGNFELKVSDANATLIFSFIGYKPQEVSLAGRTKLDVVLEEETKSLDEVVVIGYGTQKKKDLTGAVSVVNATDIKNVTATTLGEAMQGLATGVTVKASGKPGAEASIEIRGIGNFSNNSPLYVIDGILVDANRDFNMNDIESVQVLKDASAAAIYGSRAANGVIIITTKKGKEGPMKVDFSTKLSFQNLPRYDIMDREEFIKFNNMAYDNAGIPRQNHLSGNTDWQDEVFKTGVNQDYNLSFSGGTKAATFLMSMNYLSNSGTSVGTSMERYGFRVNTEAKRGIFTIGENLAITNYWVDELNTSPHWDVIRMLPTIPVYDPTHFGGFGYGDEAGARTFGVNPFAREKLEDRINTNLRLRGNVYMDVDIFKFLKYKFNMGIETSSDNHKYLRKTGNWTLNQPFDPSIRYENRAKSLSTLLEHTLNFNFKIGEHAIDGVLGTSYQHSKYEQIAAEKRNLTTVGDLYFTVIDAGTTDPKAWGYANETAILSYLGRLNYNYADKYLVSATVRRDGSSKVKKENRWGNFPSISGAWRISKENFFGVNWINDLKLRANYGTLGNLAIDAYEYVGFLNLFPQAVFGAGQTVSTGMTQVKLANEDLKWEEKTVQNYGLDASFLNNRLTTSVEYFISETKDILVGMPIAMTTGNDGGNPRANAASLKNTGLEISATWKETKGDFKYSASVNFTTLKNEVLDLGYGRDIFYTWQTKTEIGRPIGEFYLIKTAGLFQNDQDVLNHKNSKGVVIQPDAKPGDIRYVDYNDDGQINGSDRQFVGSPWAKFEMGANINISYKNFDLGIYGFGSFGSKIFNGPRSVMDRFDDNSNYRTGIRPWTPENPNTDFPRIIYADQRNSRGDQDRWLEDGSYFKIRQLSLSYNVPKKYLLNFFEQARFTITGQNLFTFTKYTGLDPEFIAPEIFRRGHDDAAYPNPRTFTIGAQITF
jgi:TonB-dependent starch-binding outer membrane protein SusC